jgi:hypothetical protein
MGKNGIFLLPKKRNKLEKNGIFFHLSEATTFSHEEPNSQYIVLGTWLN